MSTILPQETHRATGREMDFYVGNNVWAPLWGVVDKGKDMVTEVL